MRCWPSHCNAISLLIKMIIFDHVQHNNCKSVHVQESDVKEWNCKKCLEVDHNFGWDQKKVADRESRLIPGKIEKATHSLKNPICFLKYDFLIYSSSLLLIYFTSVDSNWWNNTNSWFFAPIKFQCLITLISHIVQLFLTQVCKFCCFHAGLYILFIYAQHNLWRCPMMGDVFPKM